MINLPNSMRPGVFTETSVYSISPRGNSGPAIAVCAAAESDSAGPDFALIASAADAAAYGADSPLGEMLATLLAAGHAPVYAAAARGKEGYAAALALLAPYAEIRLVACDGGEAALAAHVDACRKAGRERVGLLAVSQAVTACETAAAVDNPRVAVVCDGGTTTHKTAAAYAAAIYASASSLSGLALPAGLPFDGALTAAEIETLLHAGVTPFEQSGGEIRCVRAMTTSRTVNGISDRTFSDLSTVLAADNVIGGIRRTIKARLRGLRNNAVTRESIASQITVELEANRAQGLIDRFLPPRVDAHPSDPTLCVATLSLQISPEMNQILISTEIAV